MQKTSQKRKTKGAYLPELMALLLLVILRCIAFFLDGMKPCGDMQLYEMAVELMTGSEISHLSNNASYVYVCILSAFMRFLGNKWMSVATLQFFLQSIVVVLFFFGIRRLFGRASSVVFFVLMSVAPKFLFGFNRITPELLPEICMGMTLVALSGFLSAYAEKRKFKVAFYGLMIGVAIGAFLWLDVYGCFLGMQLQPLVVIERLILFYILAVCAVIPYISVRLRGIKQHSDKVSYKEKPIRAIDYKEKEQTEVTEENRVSNEKQASNEIQYIPNPLPLPKKHVKREIKFDYEPPEELMKFDYELQEGQEDFDI